MIEVIRAGNRWSWQMICATGRVLAYSLESFATDLEAAEHAKAYRARIWHHAAAVDYRMGACR